MKRATILSSALRPDGSGVIILDYEHSQDYRFPIKRGLIQNAFSSRKGEIWKRINVSPHGRAESYIIDARIEGDKIFLIDFVDYEYELDERKNSARFYKISAQF